MKDIYTHRSHIFFWCVILITSFAHGFKIKNGPDSKLYFGVRWGRKRTNINLEPGQLSQNLDNDPTSIKIENGPFQPIGDIIGTYELTDETILYAVKEGDEFVLKLPVAAAPPAPLAPSPFTNTPSATAGSGSDAGDNKRSADTQQQTAGSAAT